MANKSQSGSLRVPAKGEPLSSSVHSAQWLGKLVASATGRANYNMDVAPNPPSIDLLTPKVNGSKIAVPAWSVIGAVGATPGSPTTEPVSGHMQGNVGRCQYLFYTTTDHTTAVDRIVAYPFLPGVAVRVRAAAATTRPYFPGSPVGRAVGATTIAPDEGGLILLNKPYNSGGTWYAYVMLDTVNDWDAFIVKPAAGDGTKATNFLTGRGSFTFGLLSANPADTTSTNLHDMVTTYRGTLRPRDPGEDYVDGQYVRIQYKWGEWKTVWSSCGAMTGCTGKPLVPP